MKRIFSICVAVMLMMTMLTIVPLSSSAAAEPAKLLDFYEEYLFNEHSSSGEHDVAVSWKDHAMDIVALTENTEKSDPYFTVVSSGGFSADDNQWMVIKLKNLSEVTVFEMHYGTDIHPVSGSTVAHFDISAKDSDFKTYVVNIPQANLDTAYELNGPGGIAEEDGETATVLAPLETSTWEGNVTDIRLDAMYLNGSGGNVPDGSEMLIEYLAFFPTEADAKAFSQSGPDRSSYAPPATAAPLGDDEIAPNPEAYIEFSENSSWEDYVTFDAFQNILVGDYNETSDAIVLAVEASGDPNVQMRPSIPIDAEEWPVMQIKVKLPEGTPLGGMVYWTTTDSGSLSESQTCTIKYQKTTDWQIVNINMDEKKSGTLTGDYSIIRLDVFNSCSADFDVELAYCAFFKSVEAAEQYIAKGGDFSELKTESPATKAPETSAPTPTPTTKPTTAPTTAKATATPDAADTDGGSNLWLIIIIVAVAAVIIAAVVVAIILIMKKKKNV